MKNWNENKHQFCKKKYEFKSNEAIRGYGNKSTTFQLTENVFISGVIVVEIKEKFKASGDTQFL